MANQSRTSTKLSPRYSALTLEDEAPALLSRGRCPDVRSSKSSQLHKQVSASPLHPKRQAHTTQLNVSRCRRSETFPTPDSIVVSLLRALAQAGVPLSEAEFFESLVQQTGAKRSLPSLAQLHRSFLPALRRRHELALCHILQHRDAFVFLHEATTGDGRAALGLSLLPLDRLGQSPLLLGVEILEQLSHPLVARAVARMLSEGHVLFHRVLAVVTLGSVPMIQAFAANGILGAVLPAALHVPCLFHQLELVMELWQDKLERLVSLQLLLEETLGQRPTLRHRYELFLKEHELELSVPVSSMWAGPEVWLEKVIGIAEHLSVLREFVVADEVEGPLMAKLQSVLVEDNKELMAEATFVAEHALGLLNMAQFLHQTGEPLAHRIYGELDSLRVSFSYHLDARLGPKTEQQLALCPPQLAEQFRGILAQSLSRLERLFDSHPAMPTLKAVRALDPKQLGAVGWSQVDHEQGIPGLSEVPEMEWFRYQHLAEAAPADVSLPQWWEAQAEQLPVLSPLARRSLWLPVCAPKSPFLPGGFLNLTVPEDGFTEESARLLCMLRYNRKLL
ncbi:uncharacterized protein LOC112542808 [Python bivittatus]|uniref:Uncharacterized protein LOC112542808 n=1 Tax=Python bivittatus TaxID=176946 RepID=A0A9F5MZQ6_PYTBI|nr:uncharacterized protein LOC112542808 [Python bivittatus]